MPSQLTQVAETTLELFDEKTHNIPLLLVYPRHRSHSAIVAMFLDKFGQNVIYYSLREDDASLRDWLGHMVSDASFPESFGTQTRAALAERASARDLAAAFGADLFMLRSSPYILLLDTFDRLSQSKDVATFFEALPDKMPSQAQIVINARLLPLKPWNDLVLAGKAQIVGNESALSEGIFGEDSKRGQLEVFALSGGHVYIDGMPVESWDGSLPKHLFYFFVDHPMVTRDEIFQVFWPHMSVKEATNVFHVTKRKISERLGHELTKYSSGFYVPSPKLTVHYDARRFEESANHAIEYEEDAPLQWYRAIQLYRGEFLPGISMPWVQTRRDELRNKYAEALIGLGRLHRGLGELDEALGYLQRALREKPDWEDVHRDVMMIYFQQGLREEAIAQYEQLVRTLHRMFNINPTRETTRLYEVIKAV